MITINLKGGLGNQMFQYATAKSLSLQYKVPLRLNGAYFENIPKGDVPRKYQLNTFHISPDIEFSTTTSLTQRIRQKVLSRVSSEEIRITCAHFLLAHNFPVHLDGYFQNPSYFDAVRENLLTEFSFVKNMSSETTHIQKRLSQVNGVAINVRRADYLRPDYAKVFGVLDLNYYKKAIGLLKEKVPNPFFCIFSDDPEWAKENLGLEGALFIGTDEFKDYEQMYLMTQCKHNILANSSFAWWGAWLGTNNDKIVIAPKQWTATKTADDLKVLPSNWIQI